MISFTMQWCLSWRWIQGQRFRTNSNVCRRAPRKYSRLFERALGPLQSMPTSSFPFWSTLSYAPIQRCCIPMSGLSSASLWSFELIWENQVGLLLTTQLLSLFQVTTLPVSSLPSNLSRKWTAKVSECQKMFLKPLLPKTPRQKVDCFFTRFNRTPDDSFLW